MGVIEDNVFIWTTVFAGIVTLALGIYIITTLASVEPFNTAASQIVKTNFEYLDGLILLGVIGFAAASIVLSYFIPSHPAFFFVFIIVGLLAFVITPVYTNAFAALESTPIGTIFDKMPVSIAVMNALPLIAFILSGIIAVVTYAKPFGGNPMQELG